MSLAKIEIEQTAPDRWRAEVEVGGLIARRETVTAETFRQLMIAVEGAYSDMLPKPKDELAEPAPGIMQPVPQPQRPAAQDDRRLPRHPHHSGRHR